MSRNRSDDIRDSTGVLERRRVADTRRVPIPYRRQQHATRGRGRASTADECSTSVASTVVCFCSQEELDEVFNRWSKKPEQPGKLAANWPPDRNSAAPDAGRAGNGGYLVDDFGNRFDDVILEFQLPERIVCQACTKATG